MVSLTPVRKTVERRAAAQPELWDVFLFHPWNDRHGAMKAGHGQRWINPTSHHHYKVRVLHNLLGQWKVHRAWHSVGFAFGAMRHDMQVSKADCWKFVQIIEKRRAAHGCQ